MTYPGYILGRFTMPAVSISATNAGGGPTVVNLTAGDYYIDTLCAHMQAQLNAQRPGGGGVTWTVSWSPITGLVTIAMMTGGAELHSITWTSTALRDLLGFTSNIAGAFSTTGANAARGGFIPDVPLAIDGDPARAPLVTDLRQSETPTKRVFGLISCTGYQHKNLRYVGVSRARVWDTSPADPCWERFLKDVQFGIGHSWFTSSSFVKISNNGSLVGSESSKTEWQMLGIDSIQPSQLVDQWTGAWRVVIPEIVAEGS